MAEVRHPPLPPRPETLPRPVPGLDTLYRVERIIVLAARRGEDPLSLEEIKRRMGSKGVRHQTVKTCIKHLAREGKVTYVPGRGVLWTHLGPAARKRMAKRDWERVA